MIITKAKAVVAVVDDDASVRKSLGRLLRSAEFEAVTFAGAEEYLEIMGAKPPSCLVLDVYMPGMNGLSLQAELANRDCRIPIIFITAHDDAALREQALAAGAAAYLIKPFSDSEFIDVVEAAMTRGPGGE